MGIDYRAAIFVGLPQGELRSLDNFTELLDSDELQVCSPHYDGNSEDYAIVGYGAHWSDIYGPSELKYDDAEISKLKDKFKSVTGLDAKVWISPYGY